MVAAARWSPRQVVRVVVAFRDVQLIVHSFLPGVCVEAVTEVSKSTSKSALHDVRAPFGKRRWKHDLQRWRRHAVVQLGKAKVLVVSETTDPAASRNGVSSRRGAEELRHRATGRRRAVLRRDLTEESRQVSPH